MIDDKEAATILKQQKYLEKYKQTRRHQTSYNNGGEEAEGGSSRGVIELMKNKKKNKGGQRRRRREEEESFMIVDETEEIPKKYNNNNDYTSSSSSIMDDNIIIDDNDEEENMAPIVVDQWGNSLRPLRKDDLIQRNDDGGVVNSKIVDEAVEVLIPSISNDNIKEDENRKKKKTRLFRSSKGKYNNNKGGEIARGDDASVVVVNSALQDNNINIRLKEEYNEEDDNNNNERYDDDGDDSDQSVVRGYNKIKQEDDDDEDDDDGDQSPIRKDNTLMVMSSGMTAGLVSGDDIKKQMEDAKERRNIKLKHLPDEITGKDAETVFRIGGRIVTEKEAIEVVKAKSNKRKRPPRPQAIKPEWAGGIKQDEILDEKAEHMARVMNESIRREGIDNIVDNELKNKERIDDPLILFKHKLIHSSSTTTTRDDNNNNKKKKNIIIKESKFPMPPNRFNIKPGYRWDGLVRGSNYERRWFEHKNTIEFNKREAFRWIGIDDDGN